MVSRPDTKKARAKRHKRVRGKVSGTAQCPRLCVFRSTNNIYAQIIDDVNGVTLVAANTLEKDFEGARRLRKAGQNSFLKFIHVACQIEANQLWWLDVSEYNVVKIFTKDYSKGYFQADYSELCRIYEENKYKEGEWQPFCDWIERLPYSELITGE